MEHSADFRAADVKYIREHDFVGLDFKMEGIMRAG